MLEAIVRMTERIQTLPAVATLDWLDRASEAVAAEVAPGAAGLALCAIDDGGVVGSREAVGAGVVGLGDRRARDSGASRGALAKALALAMHGLERVGRSGGAIAGWVSMSAAMTVPPALIDAAGEAEGPWGSFLAYMPLPGSTGGRGLIALVFASCAGHPPTPILNFLAATLPALGRRAVLAFGTEPTSRTSWLSAREQEVLEHLVMGRSGPEIAARMGKSAHTVHDHIKALHRKLGTATRGGLIARALGHASEEAWRFSSMEPRAWEVRAPLLEVLAGDSTAQDATTPALGRDHS